jgi:hypothetical protein
MNGGTGQRGSGGKEYPKVLLGAAMKLGHSMMKELAL